MAAVATLRVQSLLINNNQASGYLMKTKHIYLVAVAAFPLCLSHLRAEEIGGINFPQGVASFADEVVSYEPDYSGGAVPTDPLFIDPADAKGPPDYSSSTGTGSVSLGSGGRIILRFINNQLTGDNSTDPDLHIFEIGPDVEDTFVEISPDGETWFSVGKVFGSTSSIDIDAFGFTSEDSFSYVRLTDDPEEGNTSGDTVGADIDAVGAISTTPQEHVPELSIATAVMVSFPSLAGSSYTIEKSVDLEVWMDEVTDIVGDGTVKKFFFEITNPETFYRVKPAE